MRIQKIGNSNVSFYQSTKYSTWTLATGDTNFLPFANIESSSLRNYTKGQNLFLNNQGRILALKATIHGAGYSRLNLQESTGELTVYDELSKLINQSRITISQDSKTVHEDLLQNMVDPLPLIAYGETVGTPTNTHRPVSIAADNKSSLNVKRSQKSGIYFTPPLIILAGRTIDFSVTTAQGYSVPATLNNMIVQFILVTEEMPQDNLSTARQ